MVSPAGSSPVAMQGPTGQNVSNPLARVNWTSVFCRSRAVTSLTQVYPSTWSSARDGGTCRARRPMTTPSSPSKSTRRLAAGRRMVGLVGSVVAELGDVIPVVAPDPDDLRRCARRQWHPPGNRQELLCGALQKDG